MSSTPSYKPNDYADISKLINDNKYAESKHIYVKQIDHLYVLKYNKSKLTTENINSLIDEMIKSEYLYLNEIK